MNPAPKSQLQWGSAVEIEFDGGSLKGKDMGGFVILSVDGQEVIKYR